MKSFRHIKKPFCYLPKWALVVLFILIIPLDLLYEMYLAARNYGYRLHGEWLELWYMKKE